MTFKEFSHAVKQNDRLTDLINRYDTNELTDEEVQEMVDLSAAICDEEDYDPFDPSEESPVDLFGPWWE